MMEAIEQGATCQSRGESSSSRAGLPRGVHSADDARTSCEKRLLVHVSRWQSQWRHCLRAWFFTSWQGAGSSCLQVHQRSRILFPPR